MKIVELLKKLINKDIMGKNLICYTHDSIRISNYYKIKLKKEKKTPLN